MASLLFKKKQERKKKHRVRQSVGDKCLWQTKIGDFFFAAHDNNQYYMNFQNAATEAILFAIKKLKQNNLNILLLFLKYINSIGCWGDGGVVKAKEKK